MSELIKNIMNDPKKWVLENKAMVAIVVGCVIAFIVLLVVLFTPSVPKFKTVKLSFPSDYGQCLHIAEIEIKDKDNNKIVLADSMIKMSSVYTGDGIDMSSKKMIDNDNNTIAHTQCGKGESITITFPTSQSISEIKIVNRQNANSVRIVNSTLSLQEEGKTPIEFKIVRDQPVYIFKHKDNVLSLQA